MASMKWWALLGGIWLMASDTVWGCNTPVFQKVLEDRDGPPYLLYEYRRGTTVKPGEQKEGPANLKTGLIPWGRKGAVPNLDRFIIDLSRTDDPLRKEIEASLPKKESELIPADADSWGVILWPFVQNRRDRIFWSGPLKDLDLPRLIDSPARRELARLLLQKRHLVWIFVPSGEEAEDAKIEGVLRDRLKQLEQEMVLLPADGAYAPVQEAKGPSVPERPKFGLMRFVTGIPEEQSLERMLQIQELRKEKTIPLAFVICGRGRVITKLMGEQISPKSIGEVCTFACGPCYCQVDLGYDLLMTVDWDAGLEKGSDIEKALAPKPNPAAPAPAPKNAVEPSRAPDRSDAVAPANPAASTRPAPGNESK